jgi:(R,R)-butanediol dehydrogenase / meso-butanediol dehydrogenase / diacetyl reductase
LKELYNGVGPDIVFECAGSPDAFQMAIGLVRGGGQVLILGNTGETTPLCETQFVMQEVAMKATLAFTKDDIDIFLDLLAQKRFKTDGMVSDIIKLDDIVEKGFNKLINTKGLIKILLAP